MKNDKLKSTKEVSAPKGTGSSVEYSGKVTVTLKKGSRTLNKRTFNNSGTDKLFKFFSLCLAGRYREAEELRPSKIMLFKSDGDLQTTKVNPTASTSRVSEFISNTGNPTVHVSSGDDKTCSTTFHFLVPNAYIHSDAKKINQIRIYAAKDTNENKDYLAYFLLTDEDNTAWESIDPSGTDVNLILDWEMIVMNKPVEGE